jgi:hypothetical protein
MNGPCRPPPTPAAAQLQQCIEASKQASEPFASPLLSLREGRGGARPGKSRRTRAYMGRHSPRQKEIFVSKAAKVEKKKKIRRRTRRASLFWRTPLYASRKRQLAVVRRRRAPAKIGTNIGYPVPLQPKLFLSLFSSRSFSPFLFFFPDGMAWKLGKKSGEGGEEWRKDGTETAGDRAEPARFKPSQRAPPGWWPHDRRRRPT